MSQFQIDQIDFSKTDQGLIPAIIQDSNTLKVLMLGYMNKEAIEKTLADKKVTFYSRSKQRLWTKGETSSNFLYLKSIALDCDQDTLLLQVSPNGPTCHKGTDTCWGTTNTATQDFIAQLEQVIESRKNDSSGSSYVKSLYESGTHKIAQKVGEEATELVIEALMDNDGLFLEEGADLFFHYLILLHDRGFTFKDIVDLLEKRHQKT